MKAAYERGIIHTGLTNQKREMVFGSCGRIKKDFRRRISSLLDTCRGLPYSTIGNRNYQHLAIALTYTVALLGRRILERQPLDPFALI